MKRIQDQDIFLSDSILILNPSKLKNDVPFILNKTNSSFIECYNPIKDKHSSRRKSTFYPKLTKFLWRIPKKMLMNLDGIIEINTNNYHKRGWLIFFHIDLKPKFCFTKKTLLFPEKVKIIPINLVFN